MLVVEIGPIPLCGAAVGSPTAPPGMARSNLLEPILPRLFVAWTIMVLPLTGPGVDVSLESRVGRVLRE